MAEAEAVGRVRAVAGRGHLGFHTALQLYGTKGRVVARRRPSPWMIPGICTEQRRATAQIVSGNVFKLTNTQNGWEYTSLYDFTGGADGAYPVSNVTIDTDGNLYGTASGRWQH